jgi:RHS repeat-associated protein
MVALKPASMHSLKTPSLTAQITTQCVSEAFFAPQKGARYLNPQTGLWLSTDPAMGEYVPQAPINDEAKKANQNLPGMGGVFNVVNLHVYHYAGNNPVKYTDPDGRDIDDLSESEIDILLWKSDLFDTMDEAAIDFAKNYNDDSIVMNREIAAVIRFKNGKYYYEVPRVGNLDNSVSYYGAGIVANIHTHGAPVTGGLENLASPKDIDNVRKHQTTSYIVNPLGDVLRLDPNNTVPIGFDFTDLGNKAPNADTARFGVRNFKVQQNVYDRIVEKLRRK